MTATDGAALPHILQSSAYRTPLCRLTDRRRFVWRRVLTERENFGGVASLGQTSDFRKTAAVHLRTDLFRPQMHGPYAWRRNRHGPSNCSSPHYLRKSGRHRRRLHSSVFV